MFNIPNNNVMDKENGKDSQGIDENIILPDDLPPKSHFRGFEIKPRVLCERLDITPYLVKQINMKRSGIEKNLLREDNMKKIIRKCSVKLVRENLEILKQSYNGTSNARKSILNKSTPEQMCKICKKVYTSKKKLRNHVETKHLIEYKLSMSRRRVSFSSHITVHEYKEFHRCRKCTKMYEDYDSLKQHMKQMHKKRKCYICFYCNAGFLDRMIFKVHIKMHCNMCGKFFDNKKNFSDHKRTVCRVVKKHGCKTCQEVYFGYLSLKDHSYEHEGVVFVCDICKERCKSKCTLLHHIQYLHCKRRPSSLYDTIHDGSDVTYECNSCDHCSNSKETMENHTVLLPDLKSSKTTGYSDYFFCDQCSQQFDNETKMLRHKWSHFLNVSSIGHDNGIDSIKNKVKTKYKLDEELPTFFKPNVVLDKIECTNKKEEKAAVINKDLNAKEDKAIVNKLDLDETEGKTNRNLTSDLFITKSTDNLEITDKIPLLDKGQIASRRRRTLISKHQCRLCGRFYSNRYCLRRHVEAVHTYMDKPQETESLQCGVCEETFVWPSLLQTHKCIRVHIPEMPFQDARPEIQFDNMPLQVATPEIEFDNRHVYMMNSGSAPPEQDNLNISSDFMVPTPIVELTEFNNVKLVVNPQTTTHTNGYRIVVQEVPIEF